MATFEEKETILWSKLSKLCYEYEKIQTKEELIKIYNLWILGEFTEPETSSEFGYYGCYYDVEKDYKKAIKYYLMAIKLGSSDAMGNLGDHYSHVEKDYEQAKKYYLMAIVLGNSTAMNNLAHHYGNVEKDYEQAKKYYLMAIKLGNTAAMLNLADYYDVVEKNYKQAKQYYLMAIELGESIAMNNLGYLYQFVEKDYAQAKKYYLMSIKQGNITAMNNLSIYYEQRNKPTKALYYYAMAKNIERINPLLSDIITKNTTLDKYFYQSLPYLKDIKELPELIKVCVTLYTKEVDVLENAFMYAPDQEGCKAAKKDFNERLESLKK